MEVQEIFDRLLSSNPVKHRVSVKVPSREVVQPALLLGLGGTPRRVTVALLDEHGKSDEEVQIPPAFVYEGVSHVGDDQPTSSVSEEDPIDEEYFNLSEDDIYFSDDLIEDD